MFKMRDILHVFIKLVKMCIVVVYMVFFLIRRKIRSDAGNIAVEYLGEISGGILVGNIRGKYLGRM